MGPSAVWLHTDHLGTVRVKSNGSGQAIAGTRLHYHPFGERTGVETDPVKYEFTGKERQGSGQRHQDRLQNHQEVGG